MGSCLFVPGAVPTATCHFHSFILVCDGSFSRPALERERRRRAGNYQETFVQHCMLSTPVSLAVASRRGIRTAFSQLVLPSLFVLLSCPPQEIVTENLDSRRRLQDIFYDFLLLLPHASCWGRSSSHRTEKASLGACDFTPIHRSSASGQLQKPEGRKHHHTHCDGKRAGNHLSEFSSYPLAIRHHRMRDVAARSRQLNHP